METREGNKLIAEFLGFKKNRGLYLWHPPLELCRYYPKAIFEGDNTDSFKFHSSWDWLMPVVEKIEGLGYMVKIDKESIRIWTSIGGISIVNYNLKSKIETVYGAVIEFIKQYNEKKDPKPTNP